MGQSVRELKALLSQRGIDFSHCREKVELEQLLQDAEVSEDGKACPATEDAAEPFADGGFATHRADGRLCWVEFVTDGDALCHCSDGTTAIVAAAELDSMSADNLPGPKAFMGTFEDARAAAFHSGRLFVVAVAGNNKVDRGSSKPGSLQALTLSSDEVSLLIEDNAIFWLGCTEDLRTTHLQQLAPDGAPSLAMVLPLAVDAMRVLSHSPGNDRETVVQGFVEALEAFESHREAAEARLLSEDWQLRQQQDEEFEASLAADRVVEEARRAREDENAIAETIGNNGESHDSCISDLQTNQADCQKSDAAKRRAELQEPDVHEEGRAKARRLLADEFLAEPMQPAKDDIARLVLRLPTGERVQRSFAAKEPLSKLYKWVECCPLLPEASGRQLQIPTQFELATAFPQRQFGADDYEKSLTDLGLAPSAALLLIDTSV